MRKGVTIIELSIVLIVAGIVVIAAFTGYNKIYLPTKASAEKQKISAVLIGLERVKFINGGPYPVQAMGKLSSMPIMINVLGGIGAIKDVSDWTYDCSIGSNQTITLQTTPLDDPIVISIIADMINSDNDGWTATAGPLNSVTVTKPNAICR